MDYKDNSFDIIRLVAAVLIMFSHYSVAVFGLENIAYSRFLFAGASLVAFFVICDFFLIPSIERTNGLTYIIKRLLRIYPVYLVSIFSMIVAAYITNSIRGVGRVGIAEAALFAVKNDFKTEWI